MENLESRRERLFAGAGFSGAIFYSGDNPSLSNPSFKYFAGFDIDGCYLLLHKRGGAVFANKMNFEAAKSLSYYPVYLFGRDFAKTLRKAAGKRKIGAAFGELPATHFIFLAKKAKLDLVQADAKVLMARGSKSQEELSAISSAAKIARKILDRLDPWEFKTEEELCLHLKAEALRQAQGASFEPIVATGKNTSFPHHKPAAKKLESCVLVDFGVRIDGYCSDITRCYFAKSCNEMQAYEKCQDIFSEILEGLEDCKAGKDVALLSERLLQSYGFPPLVHSIGHGVGMEVHEYPSLGKQSKDELAAGTVLAIEPAAYFKRYGVRFEDMVLRTKKGWKRI